jgi:hypothetical protein
MTFEELRQAAGDLNEFTSPNTKLKMVLMDHANSPIKLVSAKVEGEVSVNMKRGELSTTPEWDDTLTLLFELDESTAFDRLVNESVQLANRIQRLDDFLTSDQYAALPEHQRMLLVKQRSLMQPYLEVLQERVVTFGPEEVQE